MHPTVAVSPILAAKTARRRPSRPLRRTARTPLSLWLAPAVWERHHSISSLLPEDIEVECLAGYEKLRSCTTPTVVVLDSDEAKRVLLDYASGGMIGLLAVQHSAGNARQVVELRDRGVERVLVEPSDLQLATHIRKLGRRLQARALLYELISAPVDS